MSGQVKPYGGINLGLMAPSHYLNQCWILIIAVLWPSPESNFIVSAKATILLNAFENDAFKITAVSPRGKWVKS